MTDVTSDNELARDVLKPGPHLGRLDPLLTRLPGIFLLVVIGAGCGAALLTHGIWESPGQSLLNGRWQRGFESNYDQLHPVRTPGVDGFGVLNYSLFGEGRPGVLVGKDGWLYTTEEFATAPTDSAQISAKLKEILQTRDTLRKGGAQLLVLLIPDKSRIYPEFLGRYRWPAAKVNVYENFRRQLMQVGVSAPDLLSALSAAKSQGELFLHTDTHWTPLGAHVGATVVAQAIRQLPLQLPAAQFVIKKNVSTSYSGDLLRFVPLGGWQTQMGPRPDQLSTPESVQQGGDGGGLLGKESVDVALVGTSYSANKKWGFESWLKTEIGADLINVAQEGLGPMIPMRDYLKSRAYKSAPPRLVIWEIPERFLTMEYL